MIEKIICLANVYANLFICLGNLAIFAGVFIAIRQLRRFIIDSEYRRRQATVEFYNSIRDRLTESLKQIKKKVPKGEVIKVSYIEKDEILRSAVKEYLSHMERFSVGVNVEVYDIVVFNRMLGGYVIKWFDRLKEVIDYYRKKYNSKNTYKDFEDMVDKIRKLRK